MPNKKEREAYGDLIYQHRPTIRTLLFGILQEKYFNLKRTKEKFYVDSAAFVPEQDLVGQLPLKYLAVVSDNEVVEMIRLNEVTAKAILSKKTKLVEFDPTTTIVKKGMVFTNKKFVEKSPIGNAEESNEI